MSVIPLLGTLRLDGHEFIGSKGNKVRPFLKTDKHTNSNSIHYFQQFFSYSIIVSVLQNQGISLKRTQPIVLLSPPF